MFPQTSRYRSIETATLQRVDAPALPYLRRRFVPAPDNATALATHVVTQGQRLDNVTAFYLGDPLLFWAVCDANRAVRPDDLMEIGRRLRIPASAVA
jgi:hypothetical protein